MNNSMDSFAYIVIIGVVGICIYLYYQKSGFQLKCIVSGVDGNKYCVRERSRLKESADLLAKITKKCQQLIAHLQQKYPTDDRIHRFAKNFNPENVSETLPTSTYTAYSENKGEKTAFCLTKKKNADKGELIDEHTLTFVMLHECSHMMSEQIGHKSEFWENFKFILEESKLAGIHEPKDYSKEPTEYCSMKIQDSPFFEI